MLPELTVLWVIPLGLGLGAVIPLVLTLPVDFADRAGAAGGLAAIMLFGGYGLSSLGPPRRDGKRPVPSWEPASRSSMCCRRRSPAG